jgi:biopolymer transport protein ExbD
MNLRSKNKIHIETGMSALSDIIFMLLIFFIIASTLAVNGEQVNLPRTAKGTPSQATTTVTITKDLRYMIDNQEFLKEDLESRLAQIYDASPDKKIILNVDRDVPTGETIELFAVLRNNNWQPFIATKPKEE